MSDSQSANVFWHGEECEYCDGPIIDKQVTLHRKCDQAYFLFENVPVGVCKECGTRYYAGNILKRIEESIRGRHKAEREVLIPIYSV